MKHAHLTRMPATQVPASKCTLARVTTPAPTAPVSRCTRVPLCDPPSRPVPVSKCSPARLRGPWRASQVPDNRCSPAPHKDLSQASRAPLTHRRLTPHTHRITEDSALSALPLDLSVTWLPLRKIQPIRASNKAVTRRAWWVVVFIIICSFEPTFSYYFPILLHLYTKLKLM